MAGSSGQSKSRQWSALRAQSKSAGEKTDTSQGSASFGAPDEIEAVRGGPLWMGRNGADILTYGGDGHCLTFGPTGSGKGVSVVVPNVLNYPGSVVCIDPKGAIAPITAARRRAMGQKVILLDPFGEVESAVNSRGQAAKWPDLPTSSVNPFGHLNKHSLDAIDDVRLITAGLIAQEDGKNRFFSDSARMVLECFILHLLDQAGRVTFDELFPLAFMPRAELEREWMPDIRASTAYGGHVAHLAGLIENLTGSAGASVWLTLYRSLNLVKSQRLLPAMLPAPGASEVKFSDMKTTPTTLYLVLPARHLETHGVWLRLMLSVLIGQLSDARRSDYPVLFVVDECAALGRLEILETAVGLMRGYGLKLWLIFQDLPQLKSVYAGRWESFVSNSGVKQFFNVNDLVTADFVSQYLGQETLFSKSESLDATTQFKSATISAVGRPLLTSDEVRRLPAHEQILFYEREKPLPAIKLCYHRDAEFKNPATGADRFLPDPYYIENKTNG